MKPEDSTQEELQRVLALKRHEQPPQTFFKSLSEKVMDRLQNPGPPPEPTLMQRLGLDFDKKPIWICLLGLAVCALLAFGLISSRGVKAPPPGTPDALGPRSLRGSAREGASLMPTPPAEPEAAGGSEPLMVAPENGSRIAPMPRPAPTPTTSVTPTRASGNPGK